MAIETEQNEASSARDAMTSWSDAPTHTLSAGGVEFAYRQLGPITGVPVVFLTHLAAVLDNWDPRVVDGIAATHRVITFDNRGVGASSGSTPTGPAGGEGIEKVTRISYLDIARGLLTRQDPKQSLFLTRTANGRRAGKEFLARLEERTDDRRCSS